MSLERTLSIVKPDAVRKNVIGKILDRLETAGLKVIACKMLLLTRDQAEEFYAVHRERAFFRELVEYMISGPVVIQVLEGEGVGVLLKAFDQASLVAGMAQLLALVSDTSTAARCVSTAEKHFSLDEGATRYWSIYERLGG